MVRFVNDIVELELSFLLLYLSLEGTNRAKYVFKNLQHFASTSDLYNLTINAKCCKLLMCSFFVVRHVHDSFEPKLASFQKYLSLEMMNKTECVLGICNAKCYNFLMSSVFVVWLVNDINELELSFFFCNNIFH